MGKPPAFDSGRFHAFVLPPPRRRLTAGVTAAMLAILGVAAIGIAVATRQPPPPPAPLAVGSIGHVVPTGDASAAPTDTPAVTSPAPPAVLPDSNPVALAIPAIGVRSRLLHVGQSGDGGIEMPPAGPLYDRAAWYRHSPTPGALGPAIVVGHVDSAAQGPSVFFRLGELRPGHRVVVTRADGSTAAFIVEGVRRFRKDRFPTRLVYGDIDHAALRLVTCGGPFDSTTGHYVDNIVVFASLDTSDHI